MKKKWKGFLSGDEQCVVRLEKKVRHWPENSDKQFASSLLKQFRAHGKLTESQWRYVRLLSKKNYARSKHDSFARIYAISADERVKIGVSRNPKKRLKALQTANGAEMEIVWQSPEMREHLAYRMEKKLHRFCKKHHVRGEWFRCGVLPRLAEFKFKALEEDQAAEMELVSEAMQRI